MKLWMKLIISATFLLFLFSCTTLTTSGPDSWEQDTIVKRIQQKRAEKQKSGMTSEESAAGKSRKSKTTAVSASKTATDIQKLLVEGAHYVKGKDELVIRGRRFTMDCTGTVLAIYYYAGIDLAKDFAKYAGNGVLRLYLYLKDHKLLYDDKLPAPGDIVFWDDTYDKNEDGAWNDELTHTGMVVSTSDWGTIDYVHLNYRKGIVFERMNLLEPDVHNREIEGETVTINSAMRMKAEPTGARWLSSHLYKILGKGYELPPD